MRQFEERMSDDHPFQHLRMRSLLDIALEYCQDHTSVLTGYLHGHANARKRTRELISFKDNVLFILLLMRSQTAQHILRARDLLLKLLQFQIDAHETVGFFPKFLHQFPKAASLDRQIVLFGLLALALKLYPRECGATACRALTDTLKKLYRGIANAAPPSKCANPLVLGGWMALKWWDSIISPNALCAIKAPQETFDAMEPSALAHAEEWGFCLAFHAAFSPLDEKDSWSKWRQFWHPQIGWWLGPYKRSRRSIRPLASVIELGLYPQSTQEMRDWPRDDHLLLLGLIPTNFSRFDELSSAPKRSYAKQCLDYSLFATPHYGGCARNWQRCEDHLDTARAIWGNAPQLGSFRLQLPPGSRRVDELDPTCGHGTTTLCYTIPELRKPPSNALPLLYLTKAPADAWLIGNERTTHFKLGERLDYRDDFVKITLHIEPIERQMPFRGQVVPGRCGDLLGEIDHWQVQCHFLSSSLRSAVTLRLSIVAVAKDSHFA